MVEELVVMSFADRYRALEVLSQLQRLKFSWSSDLNDAIAVEVEADGRLRMVHSEMLDPTNGIDALKRWKALLSAFVPLPHPPVASTPDVNEEFRGINSAASHWLKDPDLDQDFVRNVAAVLRPGNSAIFVLVRDWASAEPVLLGYSHLVLHSTTVAWRPKKAN